MWGSAAACSCRSGGLIDWALLRAQRGACSADRWQGSQGSPCSWGQHPAKPLTAWPPALLPRAPCACRCTYTAWRRTLASGKSEYKSVTISGAPGASLAPAWRYGAQSAACAVQRSGAAQPSLPARPRLAAACCAGWSPAPASARRPACSRVLAAYCCSPCAYCCAPCRGLDRGGVHGLLPRR